MRTSVAPLSALVLAGHGTRHPAGRASIAALVEAVADRLPGIPIRPAYLDHLAPTVEDALLELAGERTTRAAVIPLLLSAATHSKNDVAAAIADVRSREPRLTIRYGRPLGPHPLLVDALHDRITALGVDPDDANTAVVLAAAGAADPAANADVATMARLLFEGRGWFAVEAAYASATRPDVPTAVTRLRRLGARRVVVAPYFLGEGYLLDRMTGQALAAGADAVATPLATHPMTAELVVDRYREVVAGNVDNSCDTCMFRTPLRGHEFRVGAPLRPRGEAVS